MHYVQMMDLNDEYMCKGLENTVYNICMWYLDTIYEQQWYLGQHTHINGDRDDILQILGLVGQRVGGSLLLDLVGRVCF